MRSLLLTGAGASSLMLVVLTIAMWSRSQHVMDWLRLRAFDRATVLASSRAHVGAAIITTDADQWRSARGSVRYARFKPTDLRRQFAEQTLGFAFREEQGVYFVLVPMWSLIGVALVPLAMWILQMQKQLKTHAQLKASAYAPSLS